jgi:hypothetical protein
MHPHTPSWRSAQLIKHRDNFTYTLSRWYFGICMARLRQTTETLSQDSRVPIEVLVRMSGALPPDQPPREVHILFWGGGENELLY